MPMVNFRKSGTEAASEALAALAAAAQGHIAWPSLKPEQQHPQKVHQQQAQEAQPEQEPQQEAQQAQHQQVPQQRLQDQQWNLLAVGELAATAALASAGPLQCPRHHLCPVFAPPEKPVITLAALAVVAVPAKVL